MILTDTIVCILQNLQQQPATNSFSTSLKHTQLYKRNTHRMHLSAFSQPNVYWKRLEWLLNTNTSVIFQSTFSHISVIFLLNELQSFTMWLGNTSHEITTITKSVSVHLIVINNLDIHVIMQMKFIFKDHRLLCLLVTVLFRYRFANHLLSA